MSKISLKHSGGKVVSLNSPTAEPNANEVAFKLPNADGSDGQALVTDGSGNLSFGSVAATRNLIINGAMNVAQRGTSHTGGGYGTVDRWKIDASNLSTGSAIPKSQQSLSSSDTPYTLGFRKFARLALPAAGSPSANSYAEFQQKIEAQNISNSGWNYNSTSSFITLQFWFRCSTNQTFYGWVKSTDGTNKRYTFSFTASGNNAWTKVTKTIPGASGIQIDDDIGEGFNVVIAPFYGTDYTGSVSLDTWVTSNDATHSPDYASTWLTAGASTFDLTGVQLEVGSSSTDFQFRSFAEELALCQRYFETSHSYGVYPFTDDSKGRFIQSSSSNGAGNCMQFICYATPKRAPATITGAPCVSGNTTLGEWGYGRSGAGGTSSVTFDESGTSGFRAYNGVGANHVVCDTYGHWKAEAEL